MSFRLGVLSFSVPAKAGNQMTVTEKGQMTVAEKGKKLRENYLGSIWL